MSKRTREHVRDVHPCPRAELHTPAPVDVRGLARLGRQHVLPRRAPIVLPRVRPVPRLVRSDPLATNDVIVELNPDGTISVMIENIDLSR